MNTDNQRYNDLTNTYRPPIESQFQKTAVPTQSRKPTLGCRFGFHKWGGWETVECGHTSIFYKGVRTSIEQMCECLNCGKIRVENLR